MGGICVWLVGVVVRRYIDFLILLISTPLFLFIGNIIPTFCSLCKKFLVQLLKQLFLYLQLNLLQFYIEQYEATYIYIAFSSHFVTYIDSYTRCRNFGFC